MVGAIAGSVLSNVLSGAMNQVSQDKAFQRNVALQEKQNAYNEQQISKANAYNSPAAQVQRLKAAGLNPNLAYDTGNSMQTPNQSANVAQGAQAANYNVGMSVSDLGNLSMLNAQKENIQAQTEKLKSETTGQDLQNEYSKSTLDVRANYTNELYKDGGFALRANDADIRLKESTIENLTAQTTNLQETTKLVEQNTKFQELKNNEQELNNFYQDLFKRAEIRNLMAECNLKESECKQVLQAYFFGEKMNPLLLQQQRYTNAEHKVSSDFAWDFANQQYKANEQSRVLAEIGIAQGVIECGMKGVDFNHDSQHYNNRQAKFMGGANGALDRLTKFAALITGAAGVAAKF